MGYWKAPVVDAPDAEFARRLGSGVGVTVYAPVAIYPHRGQRVAPSVVTVRAGASESARLEFGGEPHDNIEATCGRCVD